MQRSRLRGRYSHTRFNEAPPAKGGEWRGAPAGVPPTQGFNEAPPAKGGESSGGAAKPSFVV